MVSLVKLVDCGDRGNAYAGSYELSRAIRNSEPYHHIDPGFINYRKCFSAFGGALLTRFEQHRAKADDPMAALHNNHLIVDLVLDACRQAHVVSLGELLRKPIEGETFCSTEELAGTEDV